MAESGDRGQVVVKIDSSSGCRRDNEIASLSKNESTNIEPLGIRNRDLQDQENRRPTSNSGGERELVRRSNASIERNSRLLKMKTKSRLVEPSPEQVRWSEKVVKTGGVVGKENAAHEKDDKIFNEDIPDEFKRLKFSPMTVLQWVSLIIIMAALVCSLSIPFIKKQRLWDLQLWKWEVMILVLICGRLVSGWGIRVVVFFIERSFLLRKKVLYFVYGVRKAVQNCLWLGLVLIAWNYIFDKKVEKETKSHILPHVTMALVCLLVGTLVWLLKTLLVKVFASSFHVNTFFERIQDSLCNFYVIETLLRELEEQEERAMPEAWESQNVSETSRPTNLRAEARESQNVETPMPNDLRSPRVNESGGLQKSSKVEKSSKTSGVGSKIMPIDHLHKLNPKNISAWNMTRLINIIKQGALTTLDERILNSEMEETSSMHIRSECEANEAATKIFKMVAKPGSNCIYLEDLKRYMDEDVALETMQIIGTTQCEGISEPSLRNWVVRAFKERKALASSLTDTKTAVDELHNILNVLVAIIIVIIWLFILRVPIAHFLVLISSQILLVAFIFGNTCRTVFEAIIFLFIMHPFDVGDRCEVDGVQLVVEEMNILTTVFLRYDNRKIIYPNSVLSTKPITNFHRSPDMSDAIDFCIHISTPMKKIAVMKERIKGYIESKNDHWYPSPMIVITDVEDMHRVKISVWPKHKMNFQDMGERWARRALLVEEMIQVFKELDIEYRMLPLDVNVQNMAALVSDRLPSIWKTCATPDYI